MTKRLTTEQFEAIRKRAEVATAGRWKVYRGKFGEVYVSNSGALEDITEEVFEATDANFIAHSREDIPALLDEVERLREEAVSQAERAIAAENALAEIEDIIGHPYKTESQADAILWRIKEKIVKANSYLQEDKVKIIISNNEMPFDIIKKKNR